MRRRWLAAGLALCAAVVLVLPAAANARLRPLFAAMSEPNVAPGPPTHQGGGSFTAVIDDCASPAALAPPEAPCPLPADEPWFCYGIALKDLRSRLILGALHGEGPRGRERTPGDRAPRSLTVNPGSSSGCVRLNETLAGLILGNPEGTTWRSATWRSHSGRPEGRSSL